MNRLEEIKAKAIIEKVHFKNIKTGESGWTKTVTLSEEDFNHLVQQAKHVPEYMRWWKDEVRLNIKLMEQNERYKKALERIVYEDISGWSSQDILGKVIDIAHEALEGESE